MTSLPSSHQRHSIRLKGYDYTQPGAYFVTILTYQRQNIFGEIIAGVMRMSPYGERIRRAWDDLHRHYHHVSLDEFVIMPNHVHGIIIIRPDDDVRGGLQLPAHTSRFASGW